MRMVRTIIPLLLFASLSVAHAQWTWLSPLPEGNEWFDAAFPTAQRGWITGGNGAVMATTDGGTTWAMQHTPLRTTPFIGLNVVFTDANTGLITANNGTILRTADAGMIWQLAPPPSFTIQRAALHPDGSIWGYGGNGVIARTTDVGLTWSRFPTGVSTVIYDLAFTGPNEAVAVCGGGVVLSTSDNGATWSKITLAITSDIVSVAFPNPQTGFALQQSKFLLRTTDGGATWSDTTIFVNQLRQIRFADATTGWMLSNGQGTLHRTTDGGRSWQQITVDSSLRYSFQSVRVKSATEAVVMGDGGGIFVTTDGGATWAQRGSGITRAHLSSVSALNDSTAWVFGARTAVFTADWGRTWSPNRAPASPAPALRIGHAISATRLVGGGTQGETMLSTDAGLTWTNTGTLPPAGQINQIVFVDALNGWLVGNHGTIARTGDGGATWLFTDAGVTHDFNSVHARSASEAWVAGAGGVIYSTTDAGATWTPRTSGTTAALQTITFSSPTEAWAGGQLVLLRSTDAGATWQPGTLPGLDVVYRIVFTDTQNGFYVLSRSVARTKDGGANLYRTDYPATGLRDISALSSGHLWMVGDFGTIQRYTPAPAVLLRPGALDFGDVSTNRHRNLTFFVENTGERDMNFTNASALGTGFTIVTATPQVIAPGASAPVVVRFAPPDTVRYRGIAAVQSDARLGTPTIDLGGRGIPPGIPAFLHAPTEVDFGKIKLSTTKAAEIRLENRSALNILISDQRMSGADSVHFQVARPSTFFWFPAHVDSVRALFAPQLPGAFTTRLLIASNDPVEPEYYISLRGEAINPQVTPAESPVQFGYVYVDSAKTHTLVLTNTGTDDLFTLNYAMQGLHAGDFTFTPPPTTPIAPGQTLSVPIRFAPKTWGPRTAMLYLESNDVMSPATRIPIVGNGTTTALGTVPQPGAITLAPGYPNPVRAGEVTTFVVDAAAPASITLDVVDLLGREVARVVEGSYPAGAVVLPFGTGGLAPGTYTVVLRAQASGGSARTARVRMVVMQ